MIKRLFSCLLCTLMIVGICKIPIMALDNQTASGTQKAYIVGDDWGPAVTKTVIVLDKTINSDSVSKEKFSVVEEKQSYTNRPAARTVTAAYTSDAEGLKAVQIILQLKCMFHQVKDHRSSMILLVEEMYGAIHIN